MSSPDNVHDGDQPSTPELPSTPPNPQPTVVEPLASDSDDSMEDDVTALLPTISSHKARISRKAQSETALMTKLNATCTPIPNKTFITEERNWIKALNLGQTPNIRRTQGSLNSVVRAHAQEKDAEKGLRCLVTRESVPHPQACHVLARGSKSWRVRLLAMHAVEDGTETLLSSLVSNTTGECPIAP